MDDFLWYPMEAGPTQHLSREAFPAQHSDLPFDTAAILLKFSEMLNRGLSSRAAKITDLQNLGLPIESKLDATVSRANQNTDGIQDPKDQQETAHSKIDDLENRTKWYNFRIREIPETVTDVPAAVCSIIQELIKDTLHQRLESDGLPRNIVVKPHFYTVKEEVKR